MSTEKPDSERTLAEQTEKHLTYHTTRDGYEIYFHEGELEFCILPVDEAERRDSTE